ncbi:hypothetical protein NDA16_002040 [Ustilago loliicola]|nr:hypothetical protein NDA16_002040 [Ustilago loliicola]
MLSATARPALRPRPPGQRRSSREHQHTPPPDTDTSAYLDHDRTQTLSSRKALSDIKNVVKADTRDAVNAEQHLPQLKHHSKELNDNLSAFPQENTHHDSAFEPESLTPSTSESDLDHAYLGGLDRYELEELLIEASRKVREREKKLVVAANIGKALLEKNLDLRSGIMTSMASSSSLAGLTEIEAMISDFADTRDTADMHEPEAVDNHSAYSSFHPMNSPPTTDIDIHSQGHLSPGRSDTDTTPLAHPIALPNTVPDYFSRPVATANQSSDHPKALVSDARTQHLDRSIWVPSDAGLIASQPCSPSASISSFASHALLSPADTLSRVTSKRNATGSRHRSRPSLLQLQALEAQRQLTSLGEQNDVLHHQISELQHEAESARYEGSKKLSRLNKEIRGLKAELEAATRRNVELETSGNPVRPTSASRSPLRAPVVHHRQAPASPLVLPAKAHHATVAAISNSAPNPATTEEPSPDHHGLLPSTSNLEDMVRSAQSTVGESALLAQLLAKIKELEETNSAMAKAEEDFGSRMGRAMEEDERLRDAFNTVGQDLGVEAAASTSWASPEKVQEASDLIARLSNPSRRTNLQPGFITPSHSLRSLDSVAPADAPSLISSVSSSQRRRAPGNRHVIEHRKTVRSAIRRAKKELAADIWGLHSDEAPASDGCMSRSSTEQSLGTYSIDLSGSSSASSSPRQRGLNRKASSNSIALGPAGRPRIRITPSIEDLGRRRKMQEHVLVGPPQEFPASASSNRGRTLGSELGSIFGGDDRKHDFDDDLPQRRRPVTASSSNSDKTTLQLLVLRSASSASALELRSKMMTEVKSDRPTANFGRLVPENKEEHEDDLECVLAQSVHGNVEDVFLDDSLRPRDAALLARVEAEEQGDWLADQSIIETGGLQGGDEPRGAQFDLINAVVEQEAVAWADDDDYGRTISQREAVKLGLLAPSASSFASRGTRLLKGKSNPGASIFGMSRRSNDKDQKERGATKDVAPFRLEIESSEQVEHRLHIESLLRRRRQDLLRERGFDEEWEQDTNDQEHDDQIIATYAPTPQRLQEKKRQALVAGRSNSWLASPTDASPSSRDPRRSTQKWVRDVACISPTRKGRAAYEGQDFDHDQDRSLMDLDYVRPEDGEFELLDCPTWKKQGGRGTDYFPTSFRARYHPAMVKQRVVHVSQATYGWVEEWVQFAFVVFLAFVVMVEQGPNRNMRRGKPTPPALASLLPKAD